MPTGTVRIVRTRWIRWNNDLAVWTIDDSRIG